MSTTESVHDLLSTLDPTTSQQDAPIQNLLFGWLDYTLFSLMLAMSALIGVYFGFFGKKQDTTIEYLLGGKTMSIFPIAMSLIAR